MAHHRANAALMAPLLLRLGGALHQPLLPPVHGTATPRGSRLSRPAYRPRIDRTCCQVSATLSGLPLREIAIAPTPIHRLEQDLKTLPQCSMLRPATCPCAFRNEPEWNMSDRAGSGRVAGGT